MYLSNVEIYCEVIIIILTYKRDRKGPWGQEINDFEATTAERKGLIIFTPGERKFYSLFYYKL